ncbi:MAG: GGDEF domain-containing protein [Fimbriimonadaceae bacterium]|nr:GGDEF domain-containing protein [Fimbriimonadaceae bacterium]QYK56281.1 MAG: GGDEF domain-containing protein [Fimbriimonadaceae bacterium]
MERVGLDAELISKSGQRRQVRIARRLLSDGSELGIVTDMSISGSLGTALVEEMRRMTRLAEEDPVTGLLNRRAFNEGLRRLEESSGGDYGVIVVDMDQFKKINDTHGHVAGDAALKIFAERLRQSLRGHDLLARFGGDEFAALLPEIGEGDLIETAERLRHVLKVEAIVEGTALHLDATLGYAHATPNPHTVFKRADASMYRAKRRKKQLARAATLNPGTSPDSAESLPA